MSLLRLSFLLLIFFSCKTPKSNNLESENLPYSFDFKKTENLEDAIKEAAKTEKLVFLDIYTEWCLPCKIMDEGVYMDERLGNYYNSHFISLKVNAELFSGVMIADQYEVTGYPTLLFLNLEGKVLVEKRGSVGYDEMYGLAEQAIALGQSSE